MARRGPKDVKVEVDNRSGTLTNLSKHIRSIGGIKRTSMMADDAQGFGDNLLRRDRVEHELDQELSGYLEMLVAEKEATGLSPAEARRAARLEFGGLDQVKEHCRDARRTRWLEDLGRDLRFGGRGFRQRPGFTSAVLLIVALGVGAAVAIFSVANAVFRPSPPVSRGRSSRLTGAIAIRWIWPES